MVRALCVVVIAAASALAAATLEAGLDYFGDPSGSIDALVRGDLDGFFAEQPLMGSLSLLVRAPFVALVFDAGIDAVYFVGVVPCLAALVALTLVLLRWMQAEDRPAGERLAVALVCLGSPLAVKAVHWGHPEELLAAALAVGAVLAAGRGRALAAGVLLGLAFATKQWALLATLPAMLALPAASRVRFAGAAAAVGAVLVLPMLLGDPERFMTVMRAAGSGDPAYVLGLRADSNLGAHVMPHDVFWPFATQATVDGHTLSFVPEAVAMIAHPLLLMLGFALPLALWRRAGTLSALTACKALALVLALRGLLDPMSLDYYHVPLVVALGACAALGGRRELDAVLLATAGLAIAFAEPAVSVAEIEQHGTIKFLVYVATMAPLVAWLARDLWVRDCGPAPAGVMSAPGGWAAEPLASQQLSPR